MATASDVLNVLLLEDNLDDAELIRNELELAGFRTRVRHVEDRESFVRELEDAPDVILSDYSLPRFDAISALALAKKRLATTPFIIVSGVLSDDAASLAIRQGAWDYLLKDRMGRLGPAIRHALSEREIREDKERAQARLQHVNDRLESALSQIQVAHSKLEDAHERLKDNQSQLVQAEKMGSLGQLTAGVAHEINNPVGFIRSNLERLDDYVDVFTGLFGAFERLEAAVRGNVDASDTLVEIDRLRSRRDIAFIRDDIGLLIDESRSGIEQINEIVKGLKNFARKDEPDLQLANVNDCIEDTLRLVWNELKYRFELVKELAPLPPIQCHPGQLNQVFMNLVMNAVQATDDRGTITIRTRREAQHVVASVSDTGCGIEPDVRSQIFDPFYTTKPVGQGTGLGLSISYGIVTRHRGAIEVDSTPGEGTTFTIRLPIPEENDG